METNKLLNSLKTRVVDRLGIPRIGSAKKCKSEDPSPLEDLCSPVPKSAKLFQKVQKSPNSANDYCTGHEVEFPEPHMGDPLRCHNLNACTIEAPAKQ